MLEIFDLFGYLVRKMAPRAKNSCLDKSVKILLSVKPQKCMRTVSNFASCKMAINELLLRAPAIFPLGCSDFRYESSVYLEWVDLLRTDIVRKRVAQVSQPKDGIFAG